MNKQLIHTTMKKAIALLACVLAIGAASAQENNTKKFENIQSKKHRCYE